MQENELVEFDITSLDKNFRHLCNTPSDINEHLPVLRCYAEKVKHITEMGVRQGNSTIAFISGKPLKIISYDIDDCCFAKELIFGCKPLSSEWIFIQSDVTQIEIEQTELLFIDTYHTYKQLKTELELHSARVEKYLIFHDVVTYGEIGEDGTLPGLQQAVIEFLENNKMWEVKEYFPKNNGLLVLEKI